jgi:hypothetical protein
MTVAWLGFSTVGVNNHWPPRDRNYELKKKLNSLLDFLFIFLNNLKYVEPRESNLFIQNIYFATHLLRPFCCCPLDSCFRGVRSTPSY